mgnify:CR=1 FL=1
MFSRDVFKDEKAPAYALLITTIKKYGLDSLEWEPEILRAEIDRDYDIHISDLQNDKIQAAMNVLTSDHFEHDWRVFEVSSHLFNNQPMDHEDVCPLEAEEIAVALAEFRLIRTDTLDEGEKLVFGEEIRAYAGHIFYEYGMHKAPKIMPTAIMPKSNKADDKDKNEALKEIFDVHASYILDYLEKIE